jgi:hypothetical protein
MTERMTHAEYVAAQRERVVQLAASILSGSIGAIEGSRVLASLQHEVEVADDDADFRDFASIASQTDALPVGQERKNWSIRALTRSIAEVNDGETWARQQIDEACRSLIRRFRAA